MPEYATRTALLYVITLGETRSDAGKTAFPEMGQGAGSGRLRAHNSGRPGLP